MNFSGSAGDMLAAMEAAGIKAPDAADAALKVAEAPASSAPVNCEDPSCAVDHSHGNHSHHSCCETGECKHKTGASTIPAPPGGWPPPPPPPRLETAGSVIICNNDDEYNKAIERAGPERLVVVDCFADWCGPCEAASLNHVAPFRNSMLPLTNSPVDLSASALLLDRPSAARPSAQRETV